MQSKMFQMVAVIGGESHGNVHMFQDGKKKKDLFLNGQDNASYYSSLYGWCTI